MTLLKTLLPDSKFDSFRPYQEQAVSDIMDSPSRFSGLYAPTGFGKSIVPVMCSLLSGGKDGGRLAYITSTKALTTQLTRDVPVTEIQGKSNYICQALAPGGEYSHLSRNNRMWSGCNVGPCHWKQPCELKESGCGYFDAYRDAGNAGMVVTNYSYWLNIHRYGQGLGQFDILALDEFHHAHSHLSDFMKITVNSRTLRKYGLYPPQTDGLSEWTRFGRLIQSSLEQVEPDDPQSQHEVSELKREGEKIAQMKGEWIVTRTEDHIIWELISPEVYAERYLYLGIPKVILLSATLTPKSCESMGIGDVNFLEYPNMIPSRNRPVYFLPTVSMSQRRETEASLAYWLMTIDRIIRHHTTGDQPVKGIIHTTSYKRAEYVLSKSKFSSIMIGHGSRDTKKKVEQFKRAKAPCVLVSPVVTTGYDFAGDDARFQIIGKVPFVSKSDRIVAARAEKDKEYPMHLAAQELVQTTGRIVRGISDHGTTYIIDSDFGWFASRYGHLFPKGFTWKKIETISSDQ